MATIVVGYDGSDSARRALERAAGLFTNGDMLEVVGAEAVALQGKGSISAVDPIKAEERRLDLEDAATWLEQRSITPKLVEAPGDPAKAICKVATESGADLIVVGARGHGPIARALLGSVSTSVVHHAPCDVLVTHEAKGGDMTRIVVGYDASEHGDRALDRAFELANGDELVVVTAARTTMPIRGSAGAVDPVEQEWAQEALASAKARAGQRDAKVQLVEGHGNPVDAIVDKAREIDADLIIVGTHGRNASRRALLGSVSSGVVHHAACDVLVVR